MKKSDYVKHVKCIRDSEQVRDFGENLMFNIPERYLCVGLYKCPYNNDNPCDCHCFTIRKDKSFKEWYDYVNTLSDKEAYGMYMKHLECLKKKSKWKQYEEI